MVLAGIELLALCCVFIKNADILAVHRENSAVIGGYVNAEKLDEGIEHVNI
jgi:hypothetical protein